MAKESSGGNTLLAFIIGGAIGAAVGVLFAPKAGKETREALQEWFEDLEGKGEELMEEGKQLWEQGKTTAQDKAEQIRDTVESATRKVWDRS